MSSLHPLLEINEWTVLVIVRFSDVHILVGLQVVFKVLQQSDLLLKVFWIVLESVLTDHVLTIVEFTLHVLKIVEFRMCHYLRRIVEKDTAAAIAQKIA